MNEKNWREKAFLFNMISVVILIILSSVAMLLYAGGTSVNPSASGYSFWVNQLGDLYRITAWSGKDNIASRILQNLHNIVNSISLFLFAIAFRYFFDETEDEFSEYGLYGLIARGCFSLLQIFFPPDIYLVLNAFIALFMFLAATIAAYSYSIAIYHNKEYPNIYRVVFIVGAVFFGIWFSIILLAILMGGGYPAAVEKILYYVSCVIGFIVFYGAWKQIKS